MCNKTEGVGKWGGGYKYVAGHGNQDKSVFSTHSCRRLFIFCLTGLLLPTSCPVCRSQLSLCLGAFYTVCHTVVVCVTYQEYSRQKDTRAYLFAGGNLTVE